MLHRPIAAMEPEAAPVAAAGRRRPPFVAALAIVWLIGAALLTILQAKAITTRAFPDPDDYLRLGEVRDWLAGQSFWDVGQHRVDMPFGVPMHWSRLVDLPIALFELALRPLLGATGAETAATVIVPLLTLGVVMAAIAIVGRRLAGTTIALTAAALLSTALPTVVQLKPLRVDHHGWEIAFSLVALAGALAGRRRAGGVVAGTAVAIALQISLEQLPFAVALGAVIAGRWVLDGRSRSADRVLGFTVSLAMVEALLFATLRAPAGWTTYCDAVSPPHLLALAIVAIGSVASVAIGPAGLGSRAGGLLLTAGVAAIVFHALPLHCGLDPFSALGPLEKTAWLDNIPEGLPVWRSGFRTSLTATGFPIVGLVACMLAARAAAGERRALWISYGAVLAASTLLGILVLRAAGLSNAIATVPAAWAMVGVVRKAQASGRAVVRIVGSTAAILALGPLAPGVLAFSLSSSDKPDDPALEKSIRSCRSEATMRDLNRLAPARIMASIDIGPALLLGTPHAVLATGHHRGHVAIADELRAWIGNDATAERIVRAHGIGYVLICPALGETSVYAKLAPRGVSARLLSGRGPRWLQPVAMPGSPVRLWRVVPQPPAGSPSSRSAGGTVPTAEQISRSADLSPSS